MRFSPQADVAGGLVICAIGVDAVRHARQRPEFLALAWIPLLIAFVVLPVLVPLAVVAREPTRRRKLMMVPFASTGIVVAVILFAAMVRGPIGVTLAPHHLSYGVRVTDGLLIVVLYVVAVCGALLFSGYRDVVIFGGLARISVGACRRARQATAPRGMGVTGVDSRMIDRAGPGIPSPRRLSSSA